ncbi:unnamed protein product [Vitrella brassicaformis CCMP3155]|uniref:Fe2OG dioxygenase domain-containing protein n=1 Tax=Vitrella brassicaformis (strain CCMP3155) TaxID=1169540 RepID=A0A0G4H2N8_VITBC|nr:unnamed protein product [Vitrella brassicaformis CCMP3155]|eukprot:CEM37941.1 unnamed protein product [Vitrella brassicaformis CCMP3155]
MGGEPFGVTLVKDFVSEAEERQMIEEMDRWPWTASQSGRLKQDFGPNVNFKKQKLKWDRFTGLPSFSQSIVHRLHTHPHTAALLHSFAPVELCNLDYRIERGAAIDPHFDDAWLWGERLVTVSLVGNSYLTFTTSDYGVAVPMPRRSLIVVDGPARQVWRHEIRREHIIGRRVGVTMRELTPLFTPVEGASDDELTTEQRAGRELLRIANNFDGKPLNAP